MWPHRTSADRPQSARHGRREKRIFSTLGWTVQTAYILAINVTSEVVNDCEKNEKVEVRKCCYSLLVVVVVFLLIGETTVSVFFCVPSKQHSTMTSVSSETSCEDN